MKAFIYLSLLAAIIFFPCFSDEPDLKTIEAQAGQGNAQAEYELGRAYHLGKGVPQDLAKAAELYRQAAAQGNAKSMHNLGYIYLHGQGVTKDEHAAAQWFKKAADLGLPASQLQMGLAYFYGNAGVNKDYAAAIKWLLLAAKQENAPVESAAAANTLGTMNEHGYGTPQDGKQAVAWYTKAATMGEGRAFANLGRLYEEGHLVKKDPVQSYMWLKLASDKGDVMAMHLLPEYIHFNDFTAPQMAEGERKAKEYETAHPVKVVASSTPADSSASSATPTAAKPGQTALGN